MYADLKGKTALITGAGKETGIGYAVSEKLAQNGTHIILADLVNMDENNPLISGNRKELNRLAQKLESAYGVRSMAVGLDVTNSSSVQKMMDAVQKEFDHIDVLCNNAGTVFGVPNAVHTYDETAWMKTIDVNLHGVFRVSKAVIPLMTAAGGSIINTASQAAKKPPLFNGAYAAAKAGVIMLTKVMALELAGNNIRVNAVCPGIIMTDFTKWRFELEARFLGSTPQDRIEAKCREIPLGRLGTIAEVAALAAFLASRESSYMTGQALNITGGQTMEL
jgi:NAD(P)-dependent dehydrogenase (short-subunit alcohol dehydrogenase family)